jgi:hypothetical protein
VHSGGPAPQPQFKMEAPGRKTNVEWCRYAWDSVTNETIRSGFVKCGFVDADDEKAAVVPDNIFAASEQENELAELLVRMNLNDQQCGEIGNEDDIMLARLDDDEVDIIESDEESEEADAAADHSCVDDDEKIEEIDLSEAEENEDEIMMVAGPAGILSDDTDNDDCVMDEYEYLD